LRRSAIPLTSHQSPFDALTLASIELVEMLRAGFSPTCSTFGDDIFQKVCCASWGLSHNRATPRNDAIVRKQCPIWRNEKPGSRFQEPVLLIVGQDLNDGLFGFRTISGMVFARSAPNEANNVAKKQTATKRVLVGQNIEGMRIRVARVGILGAGGIWILKPEQICG
jgi:hypothetical protein